MYRPQHDNGDSGWFETHAFRDAWKTCIYNALHPIDHIKLSFVCKMFLRDLKERNSSLRASIVMLV